MTSREELQPTIDIQLRLVLEKYNCVRGSIRFQAPALLSMNGVRADGKPVLIWPPDKKLDFLVSKYVFMEPELGGLVVQADLVMNQYVYKPVSKVVLQQEAQQARLLQEQEARERKSRLKEFLASKTEVYGVELAEKVADRLKERVFGYGHRDYCGMGMEYREGMYFYGPMWDGVMDNKVEVFRTREEFVGWLARQSDASMGRLGEKDEFFWGNQTVTQDRLEAFLL